VVTFFSEITAQVALCDADCRFFLFEDLFCRFPADLADATLQSPHSGLSCIRCDHLFQSTVRNGKGIIFQSMFSDLLFQKMFLCDMQFLILRIAGDLDQFHTVKKRTRDPLHIVCRCDKQNFGKIHRDLNIMIAESDILLRIKDFQKSR